MQVRANLTILVLVFTVFDLVLSLHCLGFILGTYCRAHITASDWELWTLNSQLKRSLCFLAMFQLFRAPQTFMKCVFPTVPFKHVFLYGSGKVFKANRLYLFLDGNWTESETRGLGLRLEPGLETCGLGLGLGGRELGLVTMGLDNISATVAWKRSCRMTSGRSCCLSVYAMRTMSSRTQLEPRRRAEWRRVSAWMRRQELWWRRKLRLLLFYCTSTTQHKNANVYHSARRRTGSGGGGWLRVYNYVTAVEGRTASSIRINSSSRTRAENYRNLLNKTHNLTPIHKMHSFIEHWKLLSVQKLSQCSIVQQWYVAHVKQFVSYKYRNIYIHVANLTGCNCTLITSLASYSIIDI